MAVQSQPTTLRALLDGHDISSPQYNHPKLMLKFDHPVDDQIVVVTTRVALETKTEVVETIRARMQRAQSTITHNGQERYDWVGQQVLPLRVK